MKWKKKAADDRPFYDALIQVLFVEINIGSKAINPGLLLPTYHAKDDPNVERELGNKEPHQCSIEHMIGKRGVDYFNNLLKKAPPELIGCNSIVKINRYIKSNTDFTDCQLSAGNSINWKE